MSILKHLHLPHMRPVSYALLGFTLWVVCDICMKLAGETPLPFYETVGFMGLFSVAAMLGYYARQGRAAILWPRKPARQAARGLLAFACAVANVFALAHLPLTIFYVVVFTAPLLISLLAAWFLKEPLGLTKIVALLAGFAGVVIAIDPWNNFGGGDWIGYLAGLCSSLSFALSCISLRFMSQTETPESMAFFSAVVDAVLGLALCVFHALPLSWGLLGLLAVMGIMSAAGNLFNYSALKHAAAATVEQFHYSQIVTGAMFGFIIWHEVPSWATIAGSVVIVISGLYVAATVHQDGLKAMSAPLAVPMAAPGAND